MRRFPHMFQRASLCLGSAVEAEAGEFHRRVAVRVAEDGAEDLRGPRLVVPRRPERVELGRLPRRRSTATQITAYGRELLIGARLARARLDPRLPRYRFTDERRTGERPKLSFR